MPKEPEQHGVTRRDLLRNVGIAGAAVSVAPTGMLDPDNAAAQAPSSDPVMPAGQVREALEVLTATEATILEAVVARIIPTDQNGPGAAEARAAHYIDRALNGALAASRSAYQAGLAALDRYAQASKDAPFTALKPADQDAVLTDLEKNVATGFTPSASAFFEMVRAHTIQGTFCDPYYGGNANFVGWDLIGYPGVRMLATAQDQAIDSPSKPVRRSAYDYPQFRKQRAGGH